MSGDQPDLSRYMPEGWEGKYPPCQISVDTEGNLFGNGAPMTHPAVRRTVFNSAVYEEGLYLLREAGKTCQLEVADTLFVVCRADETDQGMLLTLNDGEQEELDPASVYLSRDQVLYCRVKGGRFPARFRRPAYYQAAELVVEHQDGFSLVLGGKKYPLKVQD